MTKSKTKRRRSLLSWIADVIAWVLIFPGALIGFLIYIFALCWRKFIQRKETMDYGTRLSSILSNAIFYIAAAVWGLLVVILFISC